MTDFSRFAIGFDHRDRARLHELWDEIFESNQCSTVAWCETPSPRTIRPPENSSMVAAACVIATGVREKIGRIDGRWRDVLLLEHRSRTVGVA